MDSSGKRTHPARGVVPRPVTLSTPVTVSPPHPSSFPPEHAREAAPSFRIFMKTAWSWWPSRWSLSLRPPLPCLLPAGCGFGIRASAAAWRPSRAGKMAAHAAADRATAGSLSRISTIWESNGANRFPPVTPVSAAPRLWQRTSSPRLEIYADLLRRPHFPDDQLDPARQVVLQELLSIEDEPGQKVMLELRRHCYGEPWGRPSYGEQAALEAISLAEIRKCFATHYRPNGTIIGVAGRIDWPRLRDEVGRLFGDWASPRPSPPVADMR